MSATFVRANVAQITVNCLFGSGAVAGALGVSSAGAHPVVFGALRAAICAVVLTVAAHGRARFAPTDAAPSALGALRASDRRHYVATSFFLFTGELFYILGVALAGPVTASLWQPSQPVFTLAFATCSGIERFTWRRALGITTTVMGCTGMLAGAMLAVADGEKGDGSSSVAGNLCLLLNCMSTPAYLIVSRPLLAQGYDAISLAAATFWGCTLCFTIAVLFSAAVLTPALGPVGWLNARGLAGCVYIALVGTALPFPLQFFANRHLNASLVSAYYALQPVVAVSLSLLVTASGIASLRRPAPSDLFGLGTILGLALVVAEELGTARFRVRGQLLEDPSSTSSTAGAREGSQHRSDGCWSVSDGDRDAATDAAVSAEDG